MLIFIFMGKKHNLLELSTTAGAHDMTCLMMHVPPPHMTWRVWRCMYHHHTWHDACDDACTTTTHHMTRVTMHVPPPHIAWRVWRCMYHHHTWHDVCDDACTTTTHRMTRVMMHVPQTHMTRANRLSTAAETCSCMMRRSVGSISGDAACSNNHSREGVSGIIGSKWKSVDVTIVI